MGIRNDNANDQILLRAVCGRCFVGRVVFFRLSVRGVDEIPPQRAAGYAMQSFFMGIGAVVASMLPFLLPYAGVSNHARTVLGTAVVPDTVRIAFYIGAVVLLLAIGWTIFRTREYAPQVLYAFHEAPVVTTLSEMTSAQRLRRGLVWSSASLFGLGIISILRLDRQLYLVCVGALIWGIALLAHVVSNKSGIS